ncbi:MFS transporter [Microbispora siamensis]|uniref:MFS transporter n=1 Tax=Microbispora siamensis TaxID=564413 RepID=A0ABQ4GSC6_9ACTN|nr:MFS transporter [Microbispora siamensis]GIH64320.1 MFS transporter [Microbispora siamensis]
MDEVRVTPVERVTTGWMTLLALAQMGVIMAMTVGNQILLPSHVAHIDPAHKEASLATVFAVGAVCTIIANPLFGAMSDRTRSRFGRRRPWIVGGALVCAASLVFLAWQESLAGLVVGWAVAQLAFTAALAAAIATVPDQVPVRQRGKVSALAGVGQLTGPLLGGVVATVLLTGAKAGFLSMAALILLLVLPFGLFTREPAEMPAAATAAVTVGTTARAAAPVAAAAGTAGSPPFDLRSFLRRLWVSPRRHPDFAWAWTSRLMITLTLAMAIGYLQYYLRDAVHYERLFPGSTVEQGVVVLVAVFTLSSVVPTLLAGWLSDRYGSRRPAVFVGGLTMAASGLVLTILTSWSAAIAASVLLGAGYGMFAAVDQAMVTQLLPADADRAKDLGIVSLANSASNTLGPVIAAPLVTSAGGYPLMYGVAAGFATLGACLIWRIRGVR